MLPNEQIGGSGDQGEAGDGGDHLSRCLGSPSGVRGDRSPGETDPQHGQRGQHRELFLQRPLADPSGADHHHAKRGGGAVLGQTTPTGKQRHSLPPERGKHAHREG